MVITDLMILKGKLCFTEFSIRFIETEAWLLLTFCLCLHNQLISITFYCHILKDNENTIN